ncbi:hypothetical protein IG631_05292 [Alternaria alternata]|jgi:hypothetical protein|nr:hypothetical protein IG631_05292 [Alternaria alternata]
MLLDRRAEHFDGLWTYPLLRHMQARPNRGKDNPDNTQVLSKQPGNNLQWPWSEQFRMRRMPWSAHGAISYQSFEQCITLHLLQPVAPVRDAMTKTRQPPHETLEALVTAA